METKEQFSNERVAQLHEHILYQASLGEPIDYEIRIDGFISVRRTNDPERFYDFTQQVTNTSKELLVLLYKGSSRNADRYCLVMRNDDTASFEEQLQAALKREKEAMLTRYEMDYLQKKIKDQKQTIKDLKRVLEKVDTGNAGVANLLKQFSSSPVIKGMFTAKTKSGDPSALGALPNEEIVTIIDSYRKSLGEECFEELLGTMLTLAQDPTLIPKVKTFITTQTNQS